MYRKIIVLLILLFEITFNYDTYAQSTAKLNIFNAPDDQSSTNILVLNDKSIIVATRVRANGWGLLHLDEHNNIIKSKEITNTRLLNKLILTNDGNIILVGSVGLNTNAEIGVIKVDMNFNIIWSKKISGAAMCYAYSALKCTNNDILITGYSSVSGTGPGDWDSFVCRITDDGNLLWQKIIVNSSSASDWLLESIEISNGNFLLSGATHINGSVDFMFIKISANGTVIFNKNFGASQNEVIYNITKSSYNGRYIISAGSWSYGLGEYDLVLAELDSNLNVVWSKVYGGNKFDFPIATLIDGNKIITAAYSKSYNSSDNFDVVAYEFNHTNGDLINTIVLGKSGEELFGSLGNVVAKKSTNKYLMIGHTKSYSSESDIFVSEFGFIPDNCCEFLNIGTTTIINQSLILNNFTTSTENTTLNNISSFSANVINFSLTRDSLCIINNNNINNSIISSNLSLCVNTPAIFSTTFVDNTYNYVWNFGDPLSGINNSATGTNVSHQFNQTGTYLVTCIISNSCISDTDSVYINITIPTPINNDIILNNTTFCENNSYEFEASYISNQHVYDWDFGDPSSGLNNNSNAMKPVHVFKNSGTYIITCIVSDACNSDTDTVIINVIEPIAINTQILNQNTSYCKTETIDFNASSDDATANYFWNFGDPNSTDNTSTLQNPSHNFSAAGIYTVRLVCTNICLNDTATLVLNIREKPLPNFDFSIDTCNSELTLINESLDITQHNYEWFINDININQAAVNYKIENNTDYTIKLLANKNTDCADSLSTTLSYIVDDTNQYLSIPDAFSPNGDNQNDVFIIKASSKCLLEELKIFDRFGSIIYEQNSEDKFYWDGKINNTIQADGVYIVHLKYNGKQYIRTLSLIK